MRTLLLLIIASGAVAYQQFPVHKMSATGQRRLPEEAVIAASGLALRQAATKNHFTEACNQIIRSGFFSSCNFRYKSVTAGGAPGYDLQFEVTEIEQTQPAAIEIPGVPAAELWTELARLDPLVRNQIPATNEATDRYIAAIEKLMERRGVPQKIKSKMDSGLDGSSVLVLFQPVHLPAVREVVFAGNHSLPSAQLWSAISKAVEGLEYTEREVRQVLDHNLIPLYEERGHLNVKFPTLKMTATGNAASVAVGVDEGAVYTLAKVEIAGDGLDVARLTKSAQFGTGKLANWRAVETAIDAIRTLFKSEGFLAPAIRQTRTLHEDRNVDLALSISRGRQYRFGQLIFSGIGEDLQRFALRQWKLKPGEPMNEPYVAEYLKSLFEDVRFNNIKSVSHRLQPAPAQDGVVDVAIQLR